jgi:hypothetical protein
MPTSVTAAYRRNAPSPAASSDNLETPVRELSEFDLAALEGGA